MVILDEVEIDSQIPEGVSIPRLKEEASGVAEDLRLQKVSVVDFGWEFLHLSN